jgi:hypothetical protein
MTRSLLLVGVALMASVVGAQGPTLPPAGPNLIGNGSFEDSPIGPVAALSVPEGWHAEAYGASGQLEIVEGGAPGQGTRCLKITTTPADDKSGLHGPVIEIDPGKAYLQCGWVRVEPNPENRYGLMYGRQWLDAEGEGVECREGRSYNYVYAPGLGTEWQYFEQLLMPDSTPEDFSCLRGEIPSGTAAIRVWALSYAWAGVGYYDGLGLYEVDLPAVVRTGVYQRLADDEVDRVQAEMSAGVASLPETDAVGRKAAELLGRLDELKKRLKSEEERGALEWTAEREGADELIDEILLVQWQVKIQTMLHAADAEGQ